MMLPSLATLPTGTSDHGHVVLVIGVMLLLCIAIAVTVVRVSQARQARESKKAWAQDSGLTRRDYNKVNDAHADDTDWWHEGGDETSPQAGTWFHEAMRNPDN